MGRRVVVGAVEAGRGRGDAVEKFAITPSKPP
jgi:hypothetical protein